VKFRIKNIYKCYEDATGTAAVSVVSYTAGTPGMVLQWTGLFSL